jgi:hypothetical protein
MNMKKNSDKFLKGKTPIIIGAVLASIVCGTVFLFATSSKNEVEKFYNSSTSIKSEYTLAGTTLVKEAVDENSVKAVIGKEEATNFEPSILLSRWDGEVALGVKSDISNIPAQDRTLSSDGNKIVLDTPKVKYQMYDLPKTEQMRDGGYEFEITLKEKPETNVVSLDIDTQNLDFFYQPPLNREKQRPGETCSETQCWNNKGEEVRLRPENVVGSYAVYYQNKKSGDYSLVGGKNYKTGKAFHIFRPRIEDAKGNWIWGNLNIDTQTGKLTVTIPREFLDNAIYPVRHAAGLTIGFNSEEATGWTIADTIVANRFVPEAAGNANPGTMHIWCTSNSGTANAIMGAYADNAGTVLGQAKISTVENIVAKAIGDGSPSWVEDAAFVWTGIAASTDYWLAIIGHDNFRIYYDATGPGYNDNEYDSQTYTGTMPAAFSDSPTTDEPCTIAIYLTYTESGGGAATGGQIKTNHGTIKIKHGTVKIK